MIVYSALWVFRRVSGGGQARFTGQIASSPTLSKSLLTTFAVGKSVYTRYAGTAVELIE